MFNPENVKRYACGMGMCDEDPEGEHVLSTDYDQLLELYKKKDQELFNIGALWGLGPYAKSFPAILYGKGLVDFIREYKRPENGQKKGGPR